MRAEASPVLAVFDKKMRLEVPLFQRQYVWTYEQQWEPLWEDISRKFDEFIEARGETPVHFLGAMVLDQKQTPTTHVEKRQVIDGQQRLTTLQLFLAAFRDFCRAQQHEELAAEIESYTFNKGMLADPQVDRYKVWPTQLDRPQFVDVLSALSYKELQRRHPLVRRKYARKPDPRPRMVEAYCYFYEQLCAYFVGTESDPPLAATVPLADRLLQAYHALKNSLQVVVIDLEAGDDAQVIFETLNARGEPLLPADLVRNYIFLRAARAGDAQEPLYHQYWQTFDTPFWRDKMRQGRLVRPRSDLFLQHFLTGHLHRDIPIKQLYSEYRHWVEKKSAFQTVEAELVVVTRHARHFNRLLQPAADDPVGAFVRFLQAFDIGTIYPLMLHVLDAGLPASEITGIGQVLESYLVRRAICGLPTKSYNRIFLTVLASLQREGISRAALVERLSSLRGESQEWPSDARLHTDWMRRNVYHVLNNPKVVYVLQRLNDAYSGSMTEHITINSSLTVEHIMPQNWLAHWPLQDGRPGLGARAPEADQDVARYEASRNRDQALQTFGNLTIVTQSLNSSVSNARWSVKKPALLQMSVLKLNHLLGDYDSWDEITIKQRGRSTLPEGCQPLDRSHERASSPRLNGMEQPGVELEQKCPTVELKEILPTNANVGLSWVRGVSGAGTSLQRR